MIFPASSIERRAIAPSLLPQVHKLEKRSPGLHVLAARNFRYPVQQHTVIVRAEHYRKLNLLEKFVLRAYSEITPAPSLEELAGALGLDPLFIKSTFSDLISLRNMNKGLQVTEEGRKSLSSEKVSEGGESDTWYFVQDRVQEDASFTRYPLSLLDEDEQLENLSDSVQKELTQFPDFAFELETLPLRELGLDFHNPDEGRFVTALEPEGEPELGWRRLALFVLYDTLNEGSDNSIRLQVRSAEDQLLPKVAAWLETEMQQQHISLKTLCGLDDEEFGQEEWLQVSKSADAALVEERIEEIRRQATQQLRQKAAGQTLEKEMGTARQLRDVEIRPAFLRALQEAREQIIIYSPWINEQVVDDDFITLMEGLVQKGVHILIGYGIGRDERREERPMPPQLRQRLRAIQTPEETPGVIAAWLGNSHAKEIIIDGNIHFSGSHNWLSYRGDRLPRGETVYQVTITSEVEKAYNHLAQRFIEHARMLWAKATTEECNIALSILCYLGHEQDALTSIERARRYQLIPFWLRLARQTIAAKHEERIRVPLQRVVTLCRTVLESQDPLRTEISSALRDLLVLAPDIVKADEL